MSRSRWFWTGLRVTGLLLALVSAPASLAAERHGSSDGTASFAACETAVLDLGTPAVRWHLERGLHSVATAPGRRTFVRAGSEWAVRFLLAREGPRTLRIRARSEERMTLRALWNGYDLGTQTVRRRWAAAIWMVTG